MMSVSSEEPTRGRQTDCYPLLMERSDGTVNQDHIILIERVSDASSSVSSNLESSHRLNSSHHEERPRDRTDIPVDGPSLPSPSRTNSQSSTFGRNESFGRQHLSPFNSGFWISIELGFTLCQIVASIIVLCLSRHEHPRAPLFAWVVGYTIGCIASLPILYWRYLHRNQILRQGPGQVNQDQLQHTSVSDPSSYITISLSRSSDQDDHQNASGASYNAHPIGVTHPRLSAMVDHFKMALDCFLAVWFVVGNVWIFGGHTSASEAPNLYRLCIAYLTLSCIGYAMPFILCAMICCCLPCIVSFLGIHDNQSQIEGASEESINGLPTYKFKVKKNEIEETLEAHSEDSREGGLVAAGTEKERFISGEDAVCCICLATYVDGDELRELPCSHFFHTECVDKWLRINATCPLCKSEINKRTAESPPETNPSE